MERCAYLYILSAFPKKNTRNKVTYGKIEYEKNSKDVQALIGVRRF